MNIKNFLNNTENKFLMLKNIINLYDYVIKPEISNNKFVLEKIFLEKQVKYSLNAIYWNKNNLYGFNRIKSEITINIDELRKISNKEIKNILIEDIYKQVIKNNILML